jgi:hypothetical protein
MSTQTFLFWNLHDKPLSDSIVRLCHQREVDFLLLAESTLDRDRLHDELNRGSSKYWPIYAQPNGLAVYARQPPLTVVKVVEIPKLDPLDRINRTDSNVLFFRVEIGPEAKFNLVLVHLRSQLRGKPLDWNEGIRNVNSRIRIFETKKVRCNRTVVVGDFNMNPFDEGLVAAPGFHAMMTRDLARPEGRFVDRLPHPFFYNPMWNDLAANEAQDDHQAHTIMINPRTCDITGTYSIRYSSALVCWRTSVMKTSN